MRILIKLSKYTIIYKFGALILLFNAYIFLVSQTAIPEDEQDNVVLLVFDEDALDKGAALPDGSKPIEDLANNNPPNCGGGNVDVCINEDIKELNIRSFLFTRGNDITDDSPAVQISLPTGQLGDEGIFKFFKDDDPQISDQNGAQFSKCEFITATGNASDENNLDKIVDVRPLTRQQIFDLINQQSYCTVALTSDASVTSPAENSGDLNGLPTTNLKGATRGITAFKVVNVVDHPDYIDDPTSSMLPIVTIELFPSNQIDKICERACVPRALSKH